MKHFIDNSKCSNQLIYDYINENEKLKDEIYNLQQLNMNLNNQLNKANQINEIQYNNKIQNLYSELKIKEKEINELKLKLSKNSSQKKYVDFNDIIVIQFITLDQKINCGVKCLKTDTFAEVEEQLYQTYPEFRETNNIFVCKGNPILRFKKIYENNIQDKDKVLLVINNNN